MNGENRKYDYNVEVFVCSPIVYAVSNVDAVPILGLRLQPELRHNYAGGYLHIAYTQASHRRVHGQAKGWIVPHRYIPQAGCHLKLLHRPRPLDGTEKEYTKARLANYTQAYHTTPNGTLLELTK